MNYIIPKNKKFTTIPLIDLKVQYQKIKSDLRKVLEDIFENSNYILGKYVKNFEENFAFLQNARFCFGTGSGTAGNHLVLWALGVSNGDEIIVPTNTFIATAWGATLCWAKPVFIDCHPESYNIDPNKIVGVITPRTKAIVAVHLYGQPADIDGIKDALKSENFIEQEIGLFVNMKNGQRIFLVEDCAQAHLAEYKGKKVGTLGIASSWSFYPGKNLGAYGEAGAVMTNDPELARKFRLMRDHGSEKKYIHEMYGHNYRMEEIQGAVLGVKLKYLPEWTEKRRKIASLYKKYLKDIDEIILPKEMDYAKHVYHLFVIQVRKETGYNRDDLQKFLMENGISTGLHYPLPLHLQPCFKHLNYEKGCMSVAEQLSEQCLSLPIYPELSEEKVEYICEKIKKFFK